MSTNTFDDCVAMLEEQLVAPPRESADELLDRAEEALASGNNATALGGLKAAKGRRSVEELEDDLDEGGDD